jgi:hypothetical protein
LACRIGIEEYLRVPDDECNGADEAKHHAQLETKAPMSEAPSPQRNIPALVAKLKVENGYKVVTEAFVELIGALHDRGINARSEIARAGGIQATLALMDQCPKVMQVQAFGCTILHATMDVSDECKRIVCNGGGIPLILAAINNHTKEKIARQQGLYALKELAGVDPDSVAQGFSVILKAIECHMNDDETQKIACALLASLLTKSSSAKRREYCESFVANAGSIPVLLAALKNSLEISDTDPRVVAMNQRLPSHAMLMTNQATPSSIMLTLMHVLGFSDSSNEFADAQGFQVTVDVMRRWKDSAEMQSIACCVLSSIHAHPEHATAIGAAGGIQVVLNAIKLIRRAKAKAEMNLVLDLKFAVGALGALTFKNFDNVATARNADAVTLIVEILLEPFTKVPKTDKDLLYVKLMGILWMWISVCVDHDGATTSALISDIISRGGIPAVLTRMQQFPNNDGIQAAGCNLLAPLSSDTDGNPTAVVVNGGREVLERAKVQHAENERVQKWSEVALGYLEDVERVDRCHTCHSTAEPLMKCSRCSRAMYCNRDCQREDYNVHKKMCKQLAALGNGNK